MGLLPPSLIIAAGIICYDFLRPGYKAVTSAVTKGGIAKIEEVGDWLITLPTKPPIWMTAWGLISAPIIYIWPPWYDVWILGEARVKFTVGVTYKTAEHVAQPTLVYHSLNP